MRRTRPISSAIASAHSRCSMAIRVMLEGGYTIEEVDAITGTLIGHAKSASFRTMDVVGLDTAVHVAKNLSTRHSG